MGLYNKYIEPQERTDTVKLRQLEEINKIVDRWTKDLGQQTDYQYLREIEDVFENPTNFNYLGG